MRLITILSFFIFSFSLSAQNFSERKIKRIINKIKAFNQVHVAMSITNLETLKPVANYQAGHYMTPASNIKLLTFLASLENFDSIPAIYYQQQDSVMHFKSTGYPLLFHPFYPDHKLSDFLKEKKSLVYHLPKSKIKKQGPGWSWDDYPYYFASERSPFPIYGNSIKAYSDSIAPKFIPNIFETFPSLNGLSDVLIREKDENRFYYNSNKWSPLDTLLSPFITGDKLFIKLLENQIKVPIELSNKSKNFSWELLYTKQEEMLYKALLQDSDNGIAEALLIMISQKRFSEMNIERTIEYLKNKWVNWLPDPIEWVDGSGISRYNMLTPRTLIAILRKIYNRVGIQTIKNYFPQTGLSGTVKKFNLKNVYAKTGTLRNNHNLSGYWISPSGKTYVFSIMANHFTSPKAEISVAIVELLNKFQKKLK